MSNVTGTSLAAGTFTGMRNEVINAASSILQRKIVIVGVAGATELSGGLTVNEPKRVYSAEEVGVIAGAGTIVHRLAISAFKGSQGTETFIIPLAEGGSDVAADGEIVVTASSVKSGVLALYINGESTPVSIATGDDATTIGDAIAAKVTALTDLPVTATNALGTVTFNAKSKGSWGNDITLAVGLGGESSVEGVSLAITDMANGAGVADITPALTAMGVGDNRNENYFTAMIHGGGKDSSTLDAISQYVGEGSAPTGCYDKINGRFFRSLIGDVENDLNSLVTLAEGRKLDRANGVVVVPNSPNHPQEIAALAMGMMEATNAQIANGSYFDFTLSGVFSGSARWSDEYDSRDFAVRNGISPTMIKSGAVVLQNVITFYRPDSIPAANNGYRSQRNISIVQNFAYAIRKYFEQENWQNITIVADTAKITNPVARKRAKDIQAVKDALSFLANQFLEDGMLFSLEATNAGLAEADSVTLRQGGTGFDYTLKLVLSGEGGILNNDVIFDINFGV